MADFKTIIGLEVHVQLKTKSKMFCACDNQSYVPRNGASDGKLVEAEPNTLVCPVCLGMPGTLPVANWQAVEMTVKTGLAFGCEILPESKFDRKHYFYPDLPKGFQISQYDMPLCKGGEVEIKIQDTRYNNQTNSKFQIPNSKKIRLNRIHLEEDAGKLVHPPGGHYSLVDLNRAGTPLMEIVTDPDITSPAQARKFMEELQLALRYLSVSDADMEKGQLRCDANISITKNGQIRTTNKTNNEQRTIKMSPIVEIKNLNSFKFVEQALLYEEKRLRDDFENWPQKPTKITRGFDSKKAVTFAQRRKEEAADYRYFPEPDIPPIKLTKSQIANLESQIKELPKQKKEKYLAAGIREDVAEKIIRAPRLAEYLESAEMLENDLATFVAEQVKISETNRLKIRDLAELLNFVKEGIISKTVAKQVYAQMTRTGGRASDIIKKQGLEQVSDKNELTAAIREVVKKNPELVEKYRGGKTRVLGFFIGEIMKKTSGKANPQVLHKLLKKHLDGNNF